MTSKEAVDLFKQYHWKVEDKNKALEILEKLVEKDTPKMVIKETIKHHIDSNEFYEADYYKCPSCEKVVLYDRYQDITLHTKNKHCQECGQKLDWSDKDE